MKKGVIYLVLILLLLSPVLAQGPPVTQIVEQLPLEIKVPQQLFIKQDTNFTFHFHLFNSTSGLPVIAGDNVGCYFHLYNDEGSHIALLYNATLENNFDFEFEIDGNNFTNIGMYTYIIQCNSSNLGGFESIGFDVNRTGLTLDLAEALLYLLLAFSVFLLFLISFYFLIVTPYSNKLNADGKTIFIVKLKYVKIGLIFITHILLVWFLNILIGVSENFITLSMSFGIISFIFSILTRISLGMFFFIIVWAFFEIIRDMNILKHNKVFGG